MEAATALSGDKAQRIVDAMRASVAARGAAGSTFDHVAREAGVSRGLLHYYFGTKERLLVEVVRRDSDLRLAALDEAIAAARTADDLLHVLVARSRTWSSAIRPSWRCTSSSSPPPAARRRSPPSWPRCTGASASTWPSSSRPSAPRA